MRAVTIKPSLQQSSLLDGCLQWTGNLHSVSHAGGGQTGLQAGFGAHAVGHAGFGVHAGAHTGFGAHTGAHTGFGAHTGAQTGAHGSGAQTGAHAGWQIGAGCSHTGASSQHLLSAQPTHMSAVVHKKSNEVINPSCFFINDSFRLFLVMVD